MSSATDDVIDLRRVLHKLVACREDLAFDEATALMERLVDGDFTPAQFGALLAALRMKTEHVDELSAFVHVVRARGRRVELGSDSERAVDLCGTGGDGPSAHVFNISTTAGIVVAGTGVPVAKHGTAAISSNSGSSDTLQALGIGVVSGPEDVRSCLAAVGITYMHAPVFNDGMRHLIALRRELGLHSLFNLLGPLANPAGVRRQMTGIYDARDLQLVGRSLAATGTLKAWVVHGRDGLDELSTMAPTDVITVDRGAVSELVVDPRELGLRRIDLAEVQGGWPAESARILRSVVDGTAGRARTEIVLLNAAAALVVAERAENLQEGLSVAEESIRSGAAVDVLDRWVAWSKAQEVHT
ncbi:anthranilate phosphoribosyltransferase [Kineosporia babensis]|uniref:Anthranilate phosphoribosyltransferase n=1 Tax=Kineosporia babensis TaxID=499548 RepID=A0A9X1NMY4_9ACTN|nr:anthranilate phosphoribosyltransferase [Kineosporia babensis]MCD5317138.1 anthranilate phosphoribosyltransferase [Kineosporia babensis]